MELAPTICLLIIGIISSVNALAFPSPTSPHEANHLQWQGWTPKPTQGPYNNRFGAISDRALFARQDDDGHTCAWINKNPKYPLTCNAGSACAFYTGVTPHWWGCCTTGADQSLIQDLCTPLTSCVNNADNYNNGADWSVDGTVLLCGTSSPACWTVADQNSDGFEYYWLGCTTTALYLEAYAYTLNSASFTASSSSNPPSDQLSQPPQSTSSFVSLTPSSIPPTTSSTVQFSSSVPVVPASFNSSSPTTSSTASETSTASKSSSGDSSTSTPTSKPHHSTNTGAIAGGVVGGVAVLALIGGAGYLIWRKQRTRVDPLPEVSRTGGGNGGGYM